MPPSMPQPPKKPANWGRASKTIVFWLIVILIPVLLLQFTGAGRGDATDITDTQFRTQVAQGNVRTAVFSGATTINGEFKAKVPLGRGNRAIDHYSTQLAAPASDKIVEQLTASGVQVSREKEGASFAGFLIASLPYLLLIGFWLFLFRQMQAGGAKAFSFGKSKAKLLTGDTPKVTFADVAGADEAKVELQEIIEFLKDPQKFTKLGGRLPEGCAPRRSAGDGQDAARPRGRG